MNRCGACFGTLNNAQPPPSPFLSVPHPKDKRAPPCVAWVGGGGAEGAGVGGGASGGGGGRVSAPELLRWAGLGADRLKRDSYHWAWLSCRRPEAIIYRYRCRYRDRYRYSYRYRGLGRAAPTAEAILMAPGLLKKKNPTSASTVWGIAQ